MLNQKNIKTRKDRHPLLTGTKVMAGLVLSFSLLASAGNAYAANVPADASAISLATALSPADVVAAPAAAVYGAAAAMADTSLTLSDMLTYAIEDEYAARAEYALILDEYGVVRPFSNIINAETTHVAELTPLFAAHGVTIPEEPDFDGLHLPDTLQAAMETGVTAEILNIDMYRSFLAMELPDDVRTVFEQLLAASEKHLSAFERGVGSTGDRNGASTSENRSGYRNRTR